MAAWWLCTAVYLCLAYALCGGADDASAWYACPDAAGAMKLLANQRCMSPIFVVVIAALVRLPPRLGVPCGLTCTLFNILSVAIIRARYVGGGVATAGPLRWADVAAAVAHPSLMGFAGLNLLVSLVAPLLPMLWESRRRSGPLPAGGGGMSPAAPKRFGERPKGARQPPEAGRALRRAGSSSTSPAADDPGAGGVSATAPAAPPAEAQPAPLAATPSLAAPASALAPAAGAGASPPQRRLLYRSRMRHYIVSIKVAPQAGVNPIDSVQLQHLVDGSVAAAISAVPGANAPRVALQVAFPGCVHALLQLHSTQLPPMAPLTAALAPPLERLGCKVLAAGVHSDEETGSAAVGVRCEPAALVGGSASSPGRHVVSLVLSAELCDKLRGQGCTLRVVLAAGATPHAAPLLDARFAPRDAEWPADGRLRLAFAAREGCPLLVASLLVGEPLRGADTAHGSDRLLTTVPVALLPAGACAEVNQLAGRLAMPCLSDFIYDLGLALTTAPILGLAGGVHPREEHHGAYASLLRFAAAHDMNSCVALLHRAARHRKGPQADALAALPHRDSAGPSSPSTAGPHLHGAVMGAATAAAVSFGAWGAVRSRSMPLPTSPPLTCTPSIQAPLIITA